ncbi:zinc ribbon domain-containing protein [Thermoflavimicrobium dichotomicum]|uniref:Zinc-ribbon domain-containing protein n=1 Tax=Thermoflavimicrobium dichotomicum TaxID=46223 RepID=A0A1I3SV56_9BACL|nr:zinc ribbon domain-containing protein [Thermoflavimicrobium dichotomicum]SFJ62714.1 zinc-ribbon domain-containing protein [Thermoflavimicrobium dichotomicum]
MNCKECGNPIAENVNFCHHCGTPTVNQPFQPQGTSISQNPYLNKTKELSGNYLKFALEVLKKPVEKMEQVDQSHFVHGIITFVLFSLFLPLVTYTNLKNILDNTFLGEAIPFTETVLLPFIYFILFFALLTGIIFAVMRATRVYTTFQHVTARIGSILIVPTAFIVLAFLLSILTAVTLSMILVIFGLFSVVINICLVIYSYRKSNDRGKVDVFYTILVTYICFGILIYLLGESFFKTLFGRLFDIF